MKENSPSLLSLLMLLLSCVRAMSGPQDYLASAVHTHTSSPVSEVCFQLEERRGRRGQREDDKEDRT